MYYDSDISTIWRINSCQKAISCSCHRFRLFTVGTKMPAWDIEFIGCRAWLSCESSNLGAAGCWSNFTIQPWRGRHLQATWQTEKAAGTDFSQERKTFKILERCSKFGFLALWNAAFTKHTFSDLGKRNSEPLADPSAAGWGSCGRRRGYLGEKWR